MLRKNHSTNNLPCYDVVSYVCMFQRFTACILSCVSTKKQKVVSVSLLIIYTVMFVDSIVPAVSYIFVLCCYTGCFVCKCMLTLEPLF